MTRIKNLIEILSLDEYYGISQIIDEAKGINKMPDTWKEVKQIAKRKAINKKANGTNRSN
jgi:hypothetical protein